MCAEGFYGFPDCTPCSAALTCGGHGVCYHGPIASGAGPCVCDAHYFGPTCAKRCVPDSARGRQGCTAAGDDVCAPGLAGDGCKELGAGFHLHYADATSAIIPFSANESMFHEAAMAMLSTVVQGANFVVYRDCVATHVCLWGLFNMSISLDPTALTASSVNVGNETQVVVEALTLAGNHTLLPSNFTAYETSQGSSSEVALMSVELPLIPVASLVSYRVQVSAINVLGSGAAAVVSTSYPDKPSKVVFLWQSGTSLLARLYGTSASGSLATHLDVSWQAKSIVGSYQRVMLDRVGAAFTPPGELLSHHFTHAMLGAEHLSMTLTPNLLHLGLHAMPATSLTSTCSSAANRPNFCQFSLSLESPPIGVGKRSGVIDEVQSAFIPLNTTLIFAASQINLLRSLEPNLEHTLHLWILTTSDWVQFTPIFNTMSGVAQELHYAEVMSSENWKLVQWTFTTPHASSNISYNSLSLNITVSPTSDLEGSYDVVENGVTVQTKSKSGALVSVYRMELAEGKTAFFDVVQSSFSVTVAVEPTAIHPKNVLGSTFPDFHIPSDPALSAEDSGSFSIALVEQNKVHVRMTDGINLRLLHIPACNFSLLNITLMTVTVQRLEGAATVSMYCDGELVGAAQATNIPGPLGNLDAAALSVGSSNSHTFVGRLHGVHVHNHSLSPTAVSLLHQRNWLSGISPVERSVGLLGRHHVYNVTIESGPYYSATFAGSPPTTISEEQTALGDRYYPSEISGYTAVRVALGSGSTSEAHGFATKRAYFAPPMSGSYAFQLVCTGQLFVNIHPAGSPPECSPPSTLVGHPGQLLQVPFMGRGSVYYIEVSGSPTVPCLHPVEVTLPNGLKLLRIPPLFLKPQLPTLAGWLQFSHDHQLTPVIPLGATEQQVADALETLPNVQSVSVTRVCDSCNRCNSWDVVFSLEDVQARKGATIPLLTVHSLLTQPYTFAFASHLPARFPWKTGFQRLPVSPQLGSPGFDVLLQQLIVPGRVYLSFQLVVCNSHGCARPFVTSVSDPPPPAPALSVEGSTTGGMTRLVWGDVVSGGLPVAGFTIQLKSGKADSFVTIATLPPEQRIYAVGGLQSKTRHELRMAVFTAYHSWAQLEGLYSEPLVVTTLKSTAPGPPSVPRVIGQPTGGGFTVR